MSLKSKAVNSKPPVIDSPKRKRGRPSKQEGSVDTGNVEKSSSDDVSLDLVLPIEAISEGEMLTGPIALDRRIGPEFRFNYQLLEDESLESSLKTMARRIAVVNNQILAGVYEIGKLLHEAKGELKKRLDRVWFCKWVEDDLPFTVMTADNYMNFYRLVEEFPEILQSPDTPVRVWYSLARSTVPKEVQAAAIKQVAAGKQPVLKLPGRKSSAIVKDYAQFLSAQFELVDEVRDVLLAHNHPICRDEKELERLAALSKPQQSRVVEILVARPENLSVREAVHEVNSLRQQSQEAQLLSDLLQSPQESEESFDSDSDSDSDSFPGISLKSREEVEKVAAFSPRFELKPVRWKPSTVGGSTSYPVSLTSLMISSWSKPRCVGIGWIIIEYCLRVSRE